MLNVEAFDVADAAALAADWRRLLAGCCRTRFYDWPGWWQACARHLEPDPAAVIFFVVRRGAEPVAIVPLKRLPDALPLPGARVWGLPRHPHMPLSGFPCRAGLDARALLRALSTAIRRHSGEPCDALWFEPLLAESPLARLAGSAAQREFLKRCAEVQSCAPEEDLRLRLSPNFRSNLNKARNKLAREPDVEFAAVTQAEALPAALAAFEALEASGWKGRAGAGTAIGLHAPLSAFYRALVHDLGPQGRVVIYGLHAAGRLIAGQFCLRDDATLYLLKLAYDERCARLAPGNMLLEQVLQRARAESGIERVNLVGDPPWFRDWRPQGQEVLRLCFASPTLRGLAVRGVLGLKRRLRPLYRRMRAAPAAPRAPQPGSGAAPFPGRVPGPGDDSGRALRGGSGLARR